MRVTGGRHAGRSLRAPRGRSVRPTADRVRESLFARLGELDGAEVLDLFAGTGALGIEALSRGAARAVFVERARAPLTCLEANLDELGLEPRSRVLAGSVASALVRLEGEGARFHLVLVDPPYASAEVEAVLRGLVSRRLLATGATVVVESGRRQPLPEVAGLACLDERRYGETLIRRYAPVDPGSPGGAEGGLGSG